MKRRERPEVKQNTIFTLLWALKRAGSSFTFFGPKKYMFLHLLNPLASNAFPGQVGGSHFWGKGYVEKSAQTQYIYIYNCLGVSKFDPIFSCLFGFRQKRGLGGGG